MLLDIFKKAKKKKKKLQLEDNEFREIAMDKVIKSKLDF